MHTQIVTLEVNMVQSLWFYSFVVLVIDFVLQWVVLSSASAVALAHHLYRSICWVTYKIIRCRNENIQQDDFNMSVGMVSMLRVLSFTICNRHAYLHLRQLFVYQLNDDISRY